MHNHIIDFNIDGSVESLYHDEFSLKHLGKVSIERASHVVFDEPSQLWDVIPTLIKRYDPLPEVYSGWSTYAKAVKFEVSIFNALREHSILSAKGICSERGNDLAKLSYSRVHKEGET